MVEEETTEILPLEEEEEPEATDTEELKLLPEDLEDKEEDKFLQGVDKTEDIPEGQESEYGL